MTPAILKRNRKPTISAQLPVCAPFSVVFWHGKPSPKEAEKCSVTRA